MMNATTGFRLGLGGLSLMLAMFLSMSCGDRTTQDYGGSGSDSIGAPPPLYFGLATLEERIAGSAVVAKVRFQSVAADTERWQRGVIDIPPDNSITHIGTAVYTFTTLEYLKGTGDGTLTASVVVNGESYGHSSTGDALSEAAAYITNRDNQWDSRDAIVFLTDRYNLMPDFPRDDHYVMGEITGDPGGWGDAYTIASQHLKLWLPESSGGSGARGPRRSPANQSFLLNVPSGGASGARYTSASSTNTITLSQMKSEISKIQKEVDAGDGSQAYAECIYYKYNAEREAGYKNADREGEYRLQQEEVESASGMASDSLVYRSPAEEHNLVLYGETQPTDYGEFHLLDGDSDLFEVRWPGGVYTKRPMPSGEYRFFYNVEWHEFTPCDGQPPGRKRALEIIVNITAPSDTLHEAFFDPQAIGSGDGYISSGDVSTGDLSPAAFSTGDTTTTGDATSTGDTITITSLYTTGDTVTMSLSPYNALAGHTLDFITGDGTTSLSLDADSATGDATAGTLTWPVGSQPWSSGDELMLRITEPWYGVRVALSPREHEILPLNYTDVTISWTDPQTCTAQYFVGLYEGETVVRTWGHHPVTTASVSRDTDILWDSIPNNTWTARVTCADNDWRTVGDVPLTSSLP